MAKKHKKPKKINAVAICTYHDNRPMTYEYIRRRGCVYPRRCKRLLWLDNGAC